MNRQFKIKNRMIGKLHKKGDHWVIRYKMEDDTVATDGGELSLHPDTLAIRAPMCR